MTCPILCYVCVCICMRVAHVGYLHHVLTLRASYTGLCVHTCRCMHEMHSVLLCVHTDVGTYACLGIMCILLCMQPCLWCLCLLRQNARVYRSMFTHARGYHACYCACMFVDVYATCGFIAHEWTCVLVAYGSVYVVCAQPTTGMDPGGRRFLWNVILGG